MAKIYYGTAEQRESPISGLSGALARGIELGTNIREVKAREEALPSEITHRQAETRRIEKEVEMMPSRQQAENLKALAEYNRAMAEMQRLEIEKQKMKIEANESIKERLMSQALNGSPNETVDQMERRMEMFYFTPSGQELVKQMKANDPLSVKKINGPGGKPIEVPVLDFGDYYTKITDRMDQQVKYVAANEGEAGLKRRGMWDYYQGVVAKNVDMHSVTERAMDRAQKDRQDAPEDMTMTEYLARVQEYIKAETIFEKQLAAKSFRLRTYGTTRSPRARGSAASQALAVPSTDQRSIDEIALSLQE